MIKLERAIMYYKNNPDIYKEVLPGIKLKTLVYGEKTLFTEFRMNKSSILPAHSHPYEQTGFLISGNIRLKIGEESYDVQPGDSWCIHINVVHQAEILEDSVAVEVFSPVREDYLPYKAE